ncbi:uncharacterized protein MELLADRAFT_92052 [Melampsora larici-populina 98AG31]|uniref:Uncharacterized protein n=1 Tax=Melampsora larici-populina (strain 98AG31 / pathotype 3-4-7) TaxID=747676 RepID=F4S1C9_MELLP|nr:uncharacterized protein MELLADRAFT_92052 [Melampsora larici-populina 98AG31]EGG01539.1 hypothetical protein MELLADRAFT_92052 [Melampsora larici-populina 98AG31]
MSVIDFLSHKFSSVHGSIRHLGKTNAKLKLAKDRLAHLESVHGLNMAYFEEQWRRKKKLQSQALSQTSADYLEKLGELVELEEKLIAAQKKRSKQCGRKRQAILALPNTMVHLEEAMEDITEKLGHVEFKELTGTDDDRAKPLVKIQVAKGRLVVAKRGVIEHRRRAGTARAEKEARYLSSTSTGLQSKICTRRFTAHANTKGGGTDGNH